MAEQHPETDRVENPNKDKVFDLHDRIKAFALSNVTGYFNGKITLVRFLHRWWCNHYNRPYNDPLFSQNTIEELLLEYYEKTFFVNEKARNDARMELLDTEEDDEEMLKKLMGEHYQSKEEMMELLKGKPKE